MFLAIALAASLPVWCAPHLDINVSLDPASRTLDAEASITTEMSQLSFYLAEGFVVESAEVDGATIATDHNSLNGLQRFQIDLPDAETPRTVTVRYHGLLQPLDTEMTHDDTLNGLSAMSSQEGGYLPGSSGWHPLFESEFTYQLNSKVPQGYIAVAPGAPTNEATTDGARYASFSMGKPVDSIDLMVGRWVIGERVARIGEASVRLRTYFGEAELPLSEAYLDAAQRFIERYSNEIGPYPYTIFSVVSSPIPTGFGMPTLTYLGKSVLPYPFIRDISLGHEVLHNWWGSGVRVDPVRGNWAEGLTTFMADYAYSEDKDVQAAMRMRHGWLRDYAALPPASEQPLSAFRARHHTASAAIGYGKAAMMFYELRARLGRDAFLQAIRFFWNKHRFATASFDDLRDAFEQTSATPLTAFFNQWLERTGAPKIQVTSARVANAGGTRLELELSQDPEPFTVSVPLRLFIEKGEIDVRVELSASPQKVSIPTKARPIVLQIDSRFEVWRKLLPGEAPPILRDVIAAEHVLVTAIDPKLQNGIKAFAQAFSEGKVSVLEPANKANASSPLIVAGSKAAVATYLERLGQAKRPALIEKGSIEVWIVPDPIRKIVAVAIDPPARNETDLSLLGRRLRHLGSYSWVSVSEQGATRQGNWPIETPQVAIPK